jgi:hypothetical protein
MSAAGNGIGSPWEYTSSELSKPSARNSVLSGVKIAAQFDLENDSLWGPVSCHVRAARGARFRASKSAPGTIDYRELSR